MVVNEQLKNAIVLRQTVFARSRIGAQNAAFLRVGIVHVGDAGVAEFDILRAERGVAVYEREAVNEVLVDDELLRLTEQIIRAGTVRCLNASWRRKGPWLNHCVGDAQQDQEAIRFAFAQHRLKERKAVTFPDRFIAFQRVLVVRIKRIFLDDAQRINQPPPIRHRQKVVRPRRARRGQGDGCWIDIRLRFWHEGASAGAATFGIIQAPADTFPGQGFAIRQKEAAGAHIQKRIFCGGFDLRLVCRGRPARLTLFRRVGILFLDQAPAQFVRLFLFNLWRGGDGVLWRRLGDVRALVSPQDLTEPNDLTIFQRGGRPLLRGGCA